MANKIDLKVGQKVWIKNYRNKVDVTESSITKLGSKYFEVAGFFQRFKIETLLNDANGYTPYMRVYLSHLEVDLENEFNALRDRFKKHVNTSDYFRKMPIEKLRAIIQIIES